MAFKNFVVKNGLNVLGSSSVINGSLTVTNSLFIGGLTTLSSIRTSYVNITTSSYTITNTDSIVGVNSNTSVALTLPAHGVGRRLTVKDESGLASVNNITVTPASGVIDGAANKLLATDYQSLDIYSNGTNWFIV